MTDIHLLAHPMDGDTESAASGARRTGTRSVVEENEDVQHGPSTTSSTSHSSSTAAGNTSTSGVMSQQLRDSFAAVQAAKREASRSQASIGHRDFWERKTRECALETTVAIDSECAHWRNGIAELEVMLADAQEEAEAHQRQRDQTRLAVPQRDPVVEFPCLPVLVPPEEDACSVGTSSTDS